MIKIWMFINQYMYVLLDLYKQVLKFNLICIKTVLGYVENLKYLRAVTKCKLYLIIQP